jgi:hypothetical protein
MSRFIHAILVENLSRRHKASVFSNFTEVQFIVRVLCIHSTLIRKTTSTHQCISVYFMFCKQLSLIFRFYSISNLLLLLSLAPQPSLGHGLLHKIQLNFFEASQQFSFLQGRVVGPTPNPHPGRPGLCVIGIN